MTPRPSLAQLPNRRAPNLHRTLPTWARETKEDGHVEYRMYAPHSMGAAIFTRDCFDPGTSRAEVAAKLRMMRAVIWGRDKKATAEEAARKREGRANTIRANQIAQQRAGVVGADPEPVAPPVTVAPDVAEPSDADLAGVDSTGYEVEPSIEEAAAGVLPPELAQTVGEAEAIEQVADVEPESIHTAPHAADAPTKPAEPQAMDDVETQPVGAAPCPASGGTATAAAPAVSAYEQQSLF